MVDPITVNTNAGETLLRFRDDVVHDEPAVTLDAFLGQTNATAVRLEAGDDARELLCVLAGVRRVRALDTKHLEHGLLGCEDRAAADGADFDAGHGHGHEQVLAVVGPV